MTEKQGHQSIRVGKIAERTHKLVYGIQKIWIHRYEESNVCHRPARNNGGLVPIASVPGLFHGARQSFECPDILTIGIFREPTHDVGAFGIGKTFDTAQTIDAMNLRIVLCGTEERFAGSGINTDVGIARGSTERVQTSGGISHCPITASISVHCRDTEKSDIGGMKS
jgi:hypothetical protein